jgi:hypothetical protein
VPRPVQSLGRLGLNRARFGTLQNVCHNTATHGAGSSQGTATCIDLARTECLHPSGRGISRAVIWVLRSVIVSASDSPLALVRAPIHPSSGSSQALAVAACRCCLPGIPLGLVRVSRFGSFTTVPHEGRVTHGSTCKRSRWCRVRHRTSGGRGALLHPLGLGR